MARTNRPLTEWAAEAVYARMRILLGLLDPFRLSPLGREMRADLVAELKECVNELERRGRQGSLL